MKYCKNQLTVLITQYYCKPLSNCIIDDLISGPLTEVIQTMTLNGVRGRRRGPIYVNFWFVVTSLLSLA